MTLKIRRTLKFKEHPQEWVNELTMFVLEFLKDFIEKEMKDPVESQLQLKKIEATLELQIEHKFIYEKKHPNFEFFDFSKEPKEMLEKWKEVLEPGNQIHWIPESSKQLKTGMILIRVPANESFRSQMPHLMKALNVSTQAELRGAYNLQYIGNGENRRPDPSFIVISELPGEKKKRVYWPRMKDLVLRDSRTETWKTFCTTGKATND